MTTKSDALIKISNQFLVEFTGCTNSSAKDDKDCVKAIDGNVGPYGWQARVPAWAIFELTEERSMNSLVLISDGGSPRSFKVTLKVDGQWIDLSALQKKEDPTAQIENNGTGESANCPYGKKSKVNGSLGKYLY